jgi:hypothetical protein
MREGDAPASARALVCARVVAPMGRALPRDFVERLAARMVRRQRRARVRLTIGGIRARHLQQAAAAPEAEQKGQG